MTRDFLNCHQWRGEVQHHANVIKRILQNVEDWREIALSLQQRKSLIESLDFVVDRDRVDAGYKMGVVVTAAQRTKSTEKRKNRLDRKGTRVRGLETSRKIHASSSPLFVDPKTLSFYIRNNDNPTDVIHSFSTRKRPQKRNRIQLQSHHQGSPRSQQLILTWNSPSAQFVEVAGTFTLRPWLSRIPLYWCELTQTHWIDVLEINPSACGIQQFKFVVDGIWKCDPSYPICDDGSMYHHLNNVIVIFPRGLRLKLSHQKLRRRQSMNQKRSSSCEEVWDCIEGSSSLMASSSVPSPSYGMEKVEFLDGLGGPASQVSESDSVVPNGLSLSDGLLTIPSWAVRNNERITENDSNSAQTTPAILSKCRTVLESRWRQAVETPVQDRSTSHERGSNDGSGDSVKTPSMERQSTTPPESAMARLTQTSRSPPYRNAKYETTLTRPPIISGHGATIGDACRKRLQKVARKETEEPPPCKKLGRRARRPLSADHTLTRCLSHHAGGLRKISPSPQVFNSIKLTDWPKSVTDYLHTPEILLQLLLPSNVVRMTHHDLCLSPGWAMTPHPDKVDSGGADSFYISTDRKCLALADGVGEWDELGYSPRSFADELMLAIRDIWENKEHFVHSLMGKLPASAIAREIMKLAHGKPRSYGSATCCIAIFDCDRQQIGGCNLGDSGLCVFRRARKYQMLEKFKTKEMTHFFNCPYQLSRSPPSQVLAKIFGLTHLENGKGFVLPSEDLPKHAKTFDVDVQEGDLILLASDGVWDNLWEFETRGLCNLALSPFEALILHDENLETTSDEVATALVEAASFRSHDTRARTPFARSYGVSEYVGGKYDDITLVAAWVSRRKGFGVRETPITKSKSIIASHLFVPQRFPYTSQSDIDNDFDSDDDFLDHLYKCQGATKKQNHHQLKVSSNDNPTPYSSIAISNATHYCAGIPSKRRKRIQEGDPRRIGAQFGEI